MLKELLNKYLPIKFSIRVRCLGRMGYSEKLYYTVEYRYGRLNIWKRLKVFRDYGVDDFNHYNFNGWGTLWTDRASAEYIAKDIRSIGDVKARNKRLEERVREYDKKRKEYLNSRYENDYDTKRFV